MSSTSSPSKCIFYSLYYRLINMWQNQSITIWVYGENSRKYEHDLLEWEQRKRFRAIIEKGKCNSTEGKHWGVWAIGELDERGERENEGTVRRIKGRK
jgi:hypothetical protein